MYRLFLKPSNSSSAIETDNSNQNSRDVAESLQPASRFAELQLRREKRRTSENKSATSMDPECADARLKTCDFCRELIIISIYDQHVLDCASQNRDQSSDNDKKENDGRQNQEETDLLNQIETEANELQVARPDNQVLNSGQGAPVDFFNLFGRFRNPQRSFPRLEATQPRLPNPSFFSNIFNSIFHHGRTNESTNTLPITSGSNQPIADDGHQNPGGNDSDIFPRGALLVRTIQQGPNGSVIVRMRVIPLGGLLNDSQENTEANEPQEGRLLGSLLNLLMTLHGVHGGGFGDFLNIFQEEKGLEKEALESLPVVQYNAETFKNVEEESKKCPICLDHFEDKQEVRFLWCLHRFHKNCVDQWLDKHTNCPICKKDYSEAVKGCEETI